MPARGSGSAICGQASRRAGPAARAQNAFGNNRRPQRAPTGPASTKLLSIIQAAGWPIWFLLVCSVVALALVIERLYHLRDAVVTPPKLLEEVISVTRANLPGADVVNKLAENSVLGSVLAAGLRSVIADPRIAETGLRQSFENAGRTR